MTNGYSTVSALRGGWNAWLDAGHPVEPATAP
jgi:3-mercaptopyruvate sulfurtransferase SseA